MKIPGPVHKTIFHSLLELRNFSKDPIFNLTNLYNKFGEIIEYKLFKFNIIQLSDPEMVKDVLKKTNKFYIKENKSPLSIAFRRIFGDGLLTAEGEIWEKQRRLMNPLFSHTKILDYINVMTKKIEEETDSELSHIENNHVNIYEIVRHITREIASTIFFGKCLKDDGYVLAKHLDFMSEYILDINKMYLVPAKFPSPRNLKFNRSLKEVNKYISKVIEDNKNPTVKSNTDSILKFLLDNNVDDKQIRDEILTLYVAGHETTALSITWTLYLLMQNPKEMLRVQEEIDSIVGNDQPNFQHIVKVKYLTNSIKEALRLYPPIWRIVRQPIEDISINGYDIPKDSMILICQWVIQRSEKNFIRANEFDPNRWERDKDTINRDSFLPFGAGVRVCIGQNFALNETILILMYFIKDYEFELKSKLHPKLDQGVSVRPKGGIECYIKKRIRS